MLGTIDQRLNHTRCTDSGYSLGYVNTLPKSHPIVMSVGWLRFLGFLERLTKLKEAQNIMNIAPPIVRTARGSAEPVRLLLIGSREGIRETIDHLCVLTFCDHAEWSTIAPYPQRSGEFFSVMTKWRM
jgi:hypothetical protein